MPLARISIRNDISPVRARQIADGVHDALISALGVPPDDRFQLINRYAPEDFIFDEAFLGIRREKVVFIQITLVRGRSVEQKRSLYGHIVNNLATAGIRGEDIHITLEENAKEDWSPGNGDIPLLNAGSHVAGLSS